MSKSSKTLKNSKTGRTQAAAKSAEKSAEKQREKRIEDAAKPVTLSLRRDNYGRHLTDLAQLAVGGLGFFCFGFVVSYIISFIIDFASTEGYTFIDYWNTCEPVAACRVSDFSSAATILLLIVCGSLCLKMAFTNRHPKRRTLLSLVIMLAFAIIFYFVDFILNKVIWQ